MNLQCPVQTSRWLRKLAFKRFLHDFGIALGQATFIAAVFELLMLFLGVGWGAPYYLVPLFAASLGLSKVNPDPV